VALLDCLMCSLILNLVAIHVYLHIFIMHFIIMYVCCMYVQARVGLITGASQGSTNQCVVLRQKEAEKPVMVL